jgi:DNA-directed RNA polymerase specialized sigma24 family protein
VTGQYAGSSQDPAIKPASHSGGLPDQEGSGQIAPANSQTEDLRLSDADFHKELTAVIPHLRAFARMLCGDRDRADDLAQEALMKAWAARGSFIAGTRFRAWIYTILRHHYFGQIAVSGL